MRKSRFLIAAGVFVFALGIFLAFLPPLWKEDSKSSAAEKPRSSRSSEAIAGVPAQGGLGVDGRAPESEKILAWIFDAESRLINSRGVDEVRGILSGLLDRLDTGQPGDSVSAIESYLRSGRDAPTGLDFIVSMDGGTLEEAHTLRCWLLDLLGRIDPVAAASGAKEMLTSRQCLDGGESALAMRNLAWGAGQPMPAGDRRIFERAAREHLANAEWASRPDAGYLEGFDAAVFLPSREASRELAAILSDSRRPEASRYAARLALERIAWRGERDALAALVASPLDPVAKGEILAAVDPGNPDSMEVVRNFLGNPGEAAAQAVFWRNFPQGSRAVGPALISDGAAGASGPQIERDSAALEILDSWIAAGSFPQHAGAIQKTRTRLLEFQEN